MLASKQGTNAAPKMIKVSANPYARMDVCNKGAIINNPIPVPDSDMPFANPRFLSNDSKL